MPLAEKKRIGRLSIFHFAFTIVEFLGERDGKLGDDLKFEGIEHLHAVLKQGKGAYVVCCHLGNWEAMGAAMSKRICPSYVIVKKVGSRGMNDFVSRLRTKNGFRFFARQKKGDVFEGIQRALGQGHIVGFVMDQARPGEPRLPFFNKEAKTNTSLAAIWRRCPAPLIPAYSTRDSSGISTVQFLPEILLTLTEDASQDILNHSLVFNQAVESMIRVCPEQYFWVHDRWKP